MRIRERQFGTAAVLDLSGRIAGRGANGLLETAVHRHASEGRRVVVVNLGDVPGVDLGGLGALLSAYRVMRQVGGELRLACLTKRIHDLIVITRLLTVFDTFDSVEQAVCGQAEDIREAVPGFSFDGLAPIQRLLRRA